MVVIVAGCFTRTQAWIATVIFVAWTLYAFYILARPDRIKNDWDPRIKRLAALALVVVGLLFVFLAVYNAVTGHCLGTNLDSPSH